MTVTEDPVEAFTAYLRARGSLSANTIRAYVGHVRRLDRHLRARHIALTEATQENLRNYLCELQALPLSRHTIGRQVSAFRAFYAYARKAGISQTNPTEGIKPPRYSLNLPKAADDAQTASLESSAASPDLWGLRDLVVIDLIRSTGMRPFELVALKKADVDLAAGTIRIAGLHSQARVLPISSSLVRDLMEYMTKATEVFGGRDAALIVNRFGRGTTTRTVDRIFIKHSAAVQTDIMPRMLRHAAAVKNVRDGEPESIPKALGFTNRQSAARYVRIAQRISRDEEQRDRRPRNAGESK